MLAWVILVLLSAAVNVPIAVSAMRSRTTPRPPETVDLRGAAAAGRSWPGTTPHQQPWPDPQLWQFAPALGYRSYHAWAPVRGSSDTEFSMRLEHIGWPLPVLEIKRMWWDWNDPALSGPEPDPSPKLLAPGLVLNPLIVGSSVFMMFGAPVYAVVVLRRVWRFRGGDCPWCGYELKGLDACPECGSAPFRA